MNPTCQHCGKGIAIGIVDPTAQRQHEQQCPRRVPCPTCHTPAQQPCRSTTGRPTTDHSTRREEAR